MTQQTFRFRFAPSVPIDEPAETVRLALVAAGGVLGDARIQVDVRHSVDAEDSSITLEGATPAIELVALIFTSLLLSEFGRDEFSVIRPEPMPGARRAEVRS